MLLAVVAAVALAQQEPGIAVTLIDSAGVARREVVLATVPCARGELRVPADLPPGAPIAIEVRGDADAAVESPAPAVPMQRWPDGSVQLLQAALRATVAARGETTVHVVTRRRADGLAEPFLHRPAKALLPEPLPLWTELVDPWGRTFRAELEPDRAAGPDGVLVDAGWYRVRRFRAPHRLQGETDVGRPLLDLRAYLLTFDGERRAELTVVLDNDAPTAGPLGAVRCRGFRLCTGDERLRFLPLFANENLLPPPWPRAGGGNEQWLLGPGDGIYLGDGTAKAFRLHLFADGDEVDDAARAIAVWAPRRTVAFAELGAVRSSRAFGLLGGPAPCEPGELGDVGRQLFLWQRRARLGPFAGFGEPEDAGSSGSVRLGDSLLHNVLRWRSPDLLAAAEAMVLQHGLRPSGGRRPRAPEDTAAYREALPTAALETPHGWTPIDYEHCSAHLVFDYWWLTGDAFARDELARIGASVRAILPAVEFRTSRGEGNCLAAGVLAARATGDRELLGFLLDHVAQRLEPLVATAEPGTAIAQPPHPRVLGGREPFDAPAQMAQLLRGLATLYAATGESRLLPLVQRVADAIASSGWSEGEGPKTFVSALDSGRYTIAATPEDRSGADRMVIGALVLAAELAGDPAAAALLQGRADFLLDRELPVSAGPPVRLLAAANPWLQIALDKRKTP